MFQVLPRTDAQTTLGAGHLCRHQSAVTPYSASLPMSACSPPGPELPRAHPRLPLPEPMRRGTPCSTAPRASRRSRRSRQPSSSSRRLPARHPPRAQQQSATPQIPLQAVALSITQRRLRAPRASRAVLQRRCLTPRLLRSARQRPSLGCTAREGVRRELCCRYKVQPPARLRRVRRGRSRSPGSRASRRRGRCPPAVGSLPRRPAWCVTVILLCAGPINTVRSIIEQTILAGT